MGLPLLTEATAINTIRLVNQAHGTTRYDHTNIGEVPETTIEMCLILGQRG